MKSRRRALAAIHMHRCKRTQTCSLAEVCVCWAIPGVNRKDHPEHGEHEDGPVEELTVLGFEPILRGYGISDRIFDLLEKA
mmetsp:Transcript_105381/g.183278  ORF Transcript_105381/g.183278 Transcript_105381/m.183278 type:complete len:81 (+) Transcript_105381:52-294(+)